MTTNKNVNDNPANKYTWPEQPLQTFDGHRNDCVIIKNAKNAAPFAISGIWARSAGENGFLQLKQQKLDFSSVMSFNEANEVVEKVFSYVHHA